MSAPKIGIDDAAVRRVAARLAPVAPVARAVEHTLRFASYEQATTDLQKSGFVALGSAMFKQGHDLWQLNKASNGYALMRVAAEPSVFEEDEVQEAPSPHNKVDHLKMGSVDRYGVQVAAGDHVHYSLGGEPVIGHVVRASGGYLDVSLRGQLDSGVPSEMVMVDRTRRASIGDCSGPDCECRRASETPETMETPTENNDNESMGLHINPDKTASFISQHFGSFGATLIDSTDATLPRATVTAMNLMAQEAKGCEKCKGKGCDECMGRKANRVASWTSLNKFASPEVISGIVESIKAGAVARRASKVAGIPFALAYELRDDVQAMPVSEARAIFATAKGIKTASHDDAAYHALTQHVGEDFANHIANHVLAFQRKALRFQITAVDQTAEDYWKAYFGDYGDQWVREIKRRVKADLVRVALVKQGVDQTAADYWSNYYGDYGDKLVEEVDTAAKKKKTVSAAKTAARTPMNADATPMTLPQPVAHRDIFAGRNIIAEEEWGGNRVAIAKTASGAYQLLVRSGNAQKVATAGSHTEAITLFRNAVYTHCGI